MPAVRAARASSNAAYPVRMLPARRRSIAKIVERLRAPGVALLSRVKRFTARSEQRNWINAHPELETAASVNFRTERIDFFLFFFKIRKLGDSSSEMYSKSTNDRWHDWRRLNSAVTGHVED